MKGNSKRNSSVRRCNGFGRLSTKSFSILVALILAFTLVIPVGGVSNVYADDRIPVNAIVATSADFYSCISYGETPKNPTFTITSPEGVVDFPDSMIKWQKKKTNGEWEWWNDSNPVTEGTYRLAVQVRIDQVTGCGETHVLADPCSVTINGVSWGSMTNPSVDTTYCYNWIDSPEITIEKTAIPLNFTTYNDSIVSYVDTDRSSPFLCVNSTPV